MSLVSQQTCNFPASFLFPLLDITRHVQKYDIYFISLQTGMAEPRLLKRRWRESITAELLMKFEYSHPILITWVYSNFLIGELLILQIFKELMIQKEYPEWREGTSVWTTLLCDFITLHRQFKQLNGLSFRIFKVGGTQMTVFWLFTPCRVTCRRRFGGTCCLHLQGYRFWSRWTLKVNELQSPSAQ
jgi:hypothetical protein